MSTTSWTRSTRTSDHEVNAIGDVVKVGEVNELQEMHAIRRQDLGGKEAKHVNVVNIIGKVDEGLRGPFQEEDDGFDKVDEVDGADVVDEIGRTTIMWTRSPVSLR